MKVSGIWVSYFVVGTALMFFNFSCATSPTGLSISDVFFANRGNGMIMTATSRKLKVNSYNPSADKNSETSQLNLDDYHPIDPVPSSKASIKPGPIEHGTPLNPFIPKPSPPSPAPPKKDRLRVKWRLNRWGLIDDDSCVVCNNGAETVQHLFFQCSCTANLWKQVCDACGISRVEFQWRRIIS